MYGFQRRCGIDQSDQQLVGRCWTPVPFLLWTIIQIICLCFSPSFLSPHNRPASPWRWCFRPHTSRQSDKFITHRRSWILPGSHLKKASLVWVSEWQSLVLFMLFWYFPFCSWCTRKPLCIHELQIHSIQLKHWRLSICWQRKSLDYWMCYMYTTKGPTPRQQTPELSGKTHAGNCESVVRTSHTHKALQHLGCLSTCRWKSPGGHDMQRCADHTQEMKSTRYDKVTKGGRASVLRFICTSLVCREQRHVPPGLQKKGGKRPQQWKYLFPLFAERAEARCGCFGKENLLWTIEFRVFCPLTWRANLQSCHARC